MISRSAMAEAMASGSGLPYIKSISEAFGWDTSRSFFRFCCVSLFTETDSKFIALFHLVKFGFFRLWISFRLRTDLTQSVAQTIFLWAAIESVLFHDWRPMAFPVRNIRIIALRKCCALPVKVQRKISNDNCLSRRRVLSLPFASFRFIQNAFRQAKKIFGQQAVTDSIRALDSFRHTGVYFPSRVSSVWNKRRAALLILKWFLT